MSLSSVLLATVVAADQIVLAGRHFVVAAGIPTVLATPVIAGRPLTLNAHVTPIESNRYVTLPLW